MLTPPSRVLRSSAAEGCAMLPITNTLHGEVGKGPIRRKLTIVGVTERKRENGANSNPSLNKIAVTFELHLCSARGIKRYFQVGGAPRDIVLSGWSNLIFHSSCS